MQSALVLTGTVIALLSAVPNKAAAAGWDDCVPNGVFETSQNGGVYQLQVGCKENWTTGYGFVAIVASSYNDGQKARLVAMATAAIMSGQMFRFYATDTNCPGLTNCKLITAWSLFAP